MPKREFKTEEEKKKPKTTPFTLVDSVSSTKQDIWEEASDQYVPFMINRALSYHSDTILYANQMNMHPDIPKRMQYLYYLHTLRPKKRFAKWAKREETEDTVFIAEALNLNLKRAEEALAILTREQVEMIKRSQEKGGRIGSKEK